MLLVLVSLVIGILPIFIAVRLEPNLVLFLFLPALLFGQGIQASKGFWEKCWLTFHQSTVILNSYKIWAQRLVPKHTD